MPRTAQRRRQGGRRDRLRTSTAKTADSASTASGPSNPAHATLLDMQQRAGNAAVVSLLAPRKMTAGAGAGMQIQRLQVQRLLGIGIPGPLEIAFSTVRRSNQLVASRIAVPNHYRHKALAYARAHPSDAPMLILGLMRGPRYYQGGWILDVQQGAKAMTLDTSVFVDGDLDIGTYVHELVHVGQYASGTTAFLVSYFGASAATIAKRLLRREPLDVMQSSPHENQAYAIERRFMNWYRSNP